MLGGKAQSKARPTALGTLLNASTYGAAIPNIYGTIRSPLLAIWAANLQQHNSSGGILGAIGLGGDTVHYTEDADFLLGSNPIRGCLNAWLNQNRYPLNFLKVSFSIGLGPATVTVVDPLFYFVVGCTVDVSLTGTFNDYGGQGSTGWANTSEMPLWNKIQNGPDLGNSSGVRFAPWTYKWVPADGNVVTFPDAMSLSSTGTVNVYYAQFSALSHDQAPITFNQFVFEEQLGNGTEYADAGVPGQQIIYPEYAGLGSTSADLGTSATLPNTTIEVVGSYGVYPRGDADFMDMIEDVLKSGIIQTGAGLGLIQRGLNLNDLPGPVQKDSQQILALSTPRAIFYQPNTQGSILVAFTRTRPATGTPTIADTLVNTWTSLFANTQKGVWYCAASLPGVVDTPNVVTCAPSSTTGFNGDTFILELDPSLDTLDQATTHTGSGGPAVGTIVTTGEPSYVIAIVFCDDGVLGTVNPGWKPLYPNADNSWGQSFYQLAGATTLNFSIPIGSGTNWWVVMMSFKQSQAASYAKALGNILDDTTATIARAAARAGGLFGSATLTSQRSGAEWLKDMYECMNTWPLWSGFHLKSIPRSEVSTVDWGTVYTAPTASGPVMNIPEAFLISNGDSLIQVDNKTPSIHDPNILQIEFLDRDSDYNQSVASWPEQASVAMYGPKKGGQVTSDSTGSPQTLHMIMDPLVARKLLAIQARRKTWVEPVTFTFKGQANLELLEAGDLVLLNDRLIGITNLAARITSTTENGDGTHDFECEPFVYGVHAPDASLVVTSQQPYQPPTQANPGSVNIPVIFEPVPQLSGTSVPQLWIAVSGGADYGGCVPLVSTDGGLSYVSAGPNINGSAITGVTTNDWPAATDPDTANDLPLDLTESLGTLQSFTVADEDNFVYPCYISGGNSQIPYGLMTYAVAVLTGTNLYTLKATGGGTNHLRRCVYGAPAAVTDVDHPNGSRWAFLNPAGTGILKLTLNPKWIGQTLYFKFLAFNKFGGNEQSESDAVAYPYTPTGIPGNITGGTNNNYSIVGGALAQPTGTSITMAQAQASFLSGPTLNYNARTFVIPNPSVPTTYYVTIADPGLMGDAGTATNLVATCQTSSALVGQVGNIYIGSIRAIPGGGGTITSPGGNPSGQLFLVNGS